MPSCTAKWVSYKAKRTARQLSIKEHGGSSTMPTSPTGNDSQVSATSTTITDDASASAPGELSDLIDQLLNDLSNKFASVSSELFAKMDEMSRRIDSLEASIRAGMEDDVRREVEATNPSSSTETNPPADGNGTASPIN
ncbi:heat shock factor binding protein 1-domain-containing protein [Amylocarpus encephaloides]|uniref:Heat shock factor binding protein 1-domain-containing protein n=1 Tax=Amylocarpus encephaloides TaxID=45428 RepID=A0A9P8C738_9HELO|nr:heat shock factor binding protein 1-domain-containing protein [Amylocarpus encephaloides]